MRRLAKLAVGLSGGAVIIAIVVGAAVTLGLVGRAAMIVGRR